MTFWDSSALLPLFVEEARSARCRQLRRVHHVIAIWTMSSIELFSGLHRLVREGLLTANALHDATRRVERFLVTATVVETIDPVKDRALRILGLHPVSAADSLQLAAALALVEDRPRHRWFVTADDRLATAAEREGFSVAVPS